MNRERELAQMDELLSAYIDGELDPTTKARLETELERSPDLRGRLEGLRQTVNLVQSLPQLEAPRHFLLTPAMVKDTRQRKASVHRRRSILDHWLAPALSFATAVSALMLVITLATGPLGGEYAGDRLTEPVDSEQAVGIAEVPENASIPEGGEAEEPAFLTAATAEPTEAPLGMQADDDATPEAGAAESAPPLTETVVGTPDAAPTGEPSGGGGVELTSTPEAPVADEEESGGEPPPSPPTEQRIPETPLPEPEIIAEETPPGIARSTEPPYGEETPAQARRIMPIGLAILTLVLIIATALAWRAHLTR